MTERAAMRRLRGMVLAGALSLPLSCAGMTLARLLENARVHDSEYLAAQAHYEAAAERLDQARGAFLPVFNLSANSLSNKQMLSIQPPVVPSGRDRRFNTHGYNFQLSQPLYRPALLEQWRQAQAQLEAAREHYVQAELDLTARAAQQYLEALQFRAQRKALRIEEEAQRAQVMAMRSRQAHGHALEAERLLAEAALQTAAARQLEADGELRNRLFMLEQISGWHIDENALSEEGIALPDTVAPLQQWLDQVDEANPAVRAQRHARDAARHEIGKQRAGHKPTLDLVVNHGENKLGPSATLDAYTYGRQTNAGVQLTIPLWSGGVTNAKVREAQSLMRKAEQDLETARRQARMQAMQAWQAIQTRGAQWRAYEQALLAQTEWARSQRRAQESGHKSVVEWMNAERDRANAESDAIRARTSLMLDWIRLRVAAGDALIR